MADLVQHAPLLLRQVLLDAVQEERRLVEQAIGRLHVLDDDRLRDAPQLRLLPFAQCLSCVHDDRQLAETLALPQLLQQLEAAHVREAQVEHHAVVWFLFDRVERLLACRDGGHVNIVVADQLHDARALDVVVFDDEQVFDAPLDERADARERAFERIPRHGLRQVREGALLERALPLIGD